MTIYLDNAATTPLDPAVFAVMEPWLGAYGANPSNLDHAPGRAAAVAIDLARGQVAALLGLDSDAVLFTSSATEASNLVIKGLCGPRLAKGEAVHVVVRVHEHPCVVEPLRRMERRGATVSWVQPGRSGVSRASSSAARRSG